MQPARLRQEWRNAPRKTASRMRNYLPLIASLANRPEKKFFQSVLQHTEILLVTLKGGLVLVSSVKCPRPECLDAAAILAEPGVPGASIAENPDARVIVVGQANATSVSNR
jgi:hypothetical protein